MIIRINKDKYGIYVMDIGGMYKSLSDWLSTDIAESRDAIDCVIDIVGDCERGIIKDWIGRGNQYVVKICKENVVIEDQIYELAKQERSRGIVGIEEDDLLVANRIDIVSTGFFLDMLKIWKQVVIAEKTTTEISYNNLKREEKNANFQELR
jgi:hypothetical protein